MKQFEYDISLHSAESFQQVHVFCSANGVCETESVPHDQITRLQEILNERGQAGWNLVQISFGKNGLMAFWKRRVKSNG
jgi:hypothetical protein